MSWRSNKLESGGEEGSGWMTRGNDGEIDGGRVDCLERKLVKLIPHQLASFVFYGSEMGLTQKETDSIAVVGSLMGVDDGDWL